jgi:tRNA uridine 5-carbamoylmethylation protein Kti12
LHGIAVYVILQRNRARPDPVPDRIIARMLEQLELPDPAEAHMVDYVWNVSNKDGRCVSATPNS